MPAPEQTNMPWRLAVAAALVVVPASLASSRPNDPPRALAIALGPDAPPFVAEESMAWPHRVVSTSPWIPLHIFVWLAATLVLAALVWRFVPKLSDRRGSTATLALVSLVACAMLSSLMATPPDFASTMTAFPPLLVVASAAYGLATLLLAARRPKKRQS